MLSDFVKYVKQYWHDRPDKSTPLNADRLNHIENGIGSNSEAINQIANAVVSNIVNDPDKIASMAAVYALQEKLGTGELPSDAPNAISAINTLYSNLTRKYYSINSQGSEPILEVYGNICALQYCNSIWTSSDHIPSGFYPKILSGIWTPVSSSDDLNAANEYRLCIQNNGAVVLQKNGINISDNTSIRGQAIWII